jgi:hypothetical protein
MKPIETIWKRPTWKFNSSATAVWAAVALSSHYSSCRVIITTNWNSFNFRSVPSAESQLKLYYYILFAMAPYRVVSQLLARVQWRARAHYAWYGMYTTAIWHCQWESGWASLTVISSLPGWLRRRADSKPERPRLLVPNLTAYSCN